MTASETRPRSEIEADLNKVWVPVATVAAGFNTGAWP
jgi:hypothetical protein